MSELKPCPFCGGEAELCSGGIKYVLCKECVAKTAFCDTEAEAIEAWNRRANDGDYKLFILELFKMRTEAVCAALESSTDLGLAPRYEFEKLTSDLREAWCIEANEVSSDA